MSQLYAFDLRPYDKGQWRDLLSPLSSKRKEQILSCRFDQDRARTAGSGWLLQYALEQAGIPPEQQIITREKLGKPFLANRSDVHFSLSHSGFWAVCAVSRDPVGVDVELPRCTMELASRYFNPEELAPLENLPIMEQVDTLNRLWTAKEAFVKALGCGLTLPLRDFVVELKPNGAALRQTQSPLPYLLHEYRLEGSRICLCTTEPRPELVLVTNEH